MMGGVGMALGERFVTLLHLWLLLQVFKTFMIMYYANVCCFTPGSLDHGSALGPDWHQGISLRGAEEVCDIVYSIFLQVPRTVSSCLLFIPRCRTMYM